MALRVSSPVLVGRGAELGILLGALDEVASGSVRTVLVDGEAGIGKTRLVHELQAAARESGAIVLRGGCVRLGRDDGLPFAPVVEALRGLVRERGAADVRGLLDASTIELASLLPELARSELAASEPFEFRPDWAQTRLFEAVLVLLTRLATEGTAVVVVEDLHWADRSTRDLLTFLARNLRHDRILLVATYRSDELHRRHPLRGWASEMDRLGVIRVRLEPLEREAVREQIEAIIGQRPPAELVDAVETRSSGNPFFVEELLAAPRTDELPDSLRELLLARVATLPDEAQRLLGVAAVAGPAVDHDVLLAVAGIGDEEASPLLREASAHHLIVPSSAGERSVYTFRHALLQEAIYDDLLPRDRRRLHADYARVLQDQPEPAGAARASHLAAIAHHAEAAHDLPRAVDAWLRAARAAFRVHAAPEATHAFARCLELWDAVPGDLQPADCDLIDVLYEASLAMNGTGDLEKAREIAARAVELEGEADRGRAALLLERLGRTEWLDGDLVRATDTLQRAVGLLDDDVKPAIAARVVGGLAGLLMLRGQYSRAIELARRALDLARAAGARDAEAHALNTLGAALADSGDCSGGVAIARDALALARALDRAYEIHRAYSNLSTALEVCGKADEAAEVALEGVEWARRHGMWRLQGAFLEGNAASALFHAGRWADASSLLATEEQPAVEGVALLNQAVTAGPLAVHTGRLDDARRLLTRARKRIGRLRDMQFTGPISVALAELELADGSPESAIELVEESLELMSDTEDVRYRAELMELAVQAC
ncbi:MAG: AAA family ATPase, partial [Chloroflexota bacterium]|nr:AAA family ATPase [Chloroflexota bacterium]